MKKIICENLKNSKKVLFTYEFPFFLVAADGIHSIVGNVNTISSAYSIGESYVGTSIKKRNIVISGIINDNFKENRQILYNVFPLRQEGIFYYYEDDLKRKIKYEVENVYVSEKGVPRTFSVSLICSNPYFTDIENTEAKMSSWEPKFEFPLCSEQNVGFEFATKNVTKMTTITNDTNIEFGLTIKFKANASLTNPFLINVETQEKITIDKEMENGDQIIITTHRGNKNIVFIPDDTHIEQNINNLMRYGSKFLQMHSGVNTIRAGAETGEDNLTTEVYYCKEYEAI